MEVDSDSSDATDEVQAILDKRQYRKKTQYLIQWKGFSEDSNCWIDENDIETALTVAYNQAAVSTARSKKGAPKGTAGTKKPARPTTARLGTLRSNKNSNGNQNQVIKQLAGVAQIEAGDEAVHEASGAIQQPTGEAQMEAPGEMEQADDEGMQQNAAPQEDNSGLARGLQLEKIIGITKAKGDYNFLVKWIGSDDHEFVSGETVRVQWPRELIAFYETKLQFL